MISIEEIQFQFPNKERDWEKEKKKKKKSSFSFFIHSNSKYCVGAIFGSAKKLELIVDLPRNLFPILDASRMFIPLLLVP
jgi:hypothetical protein